MQARVRVTWVLGVAALAASVIMLGFRSQQGMAPEALPVQSAVTAGEPAVAAPGGAAIVPEPESNAVPPAAAATDARQLLREARAYLDAGRAADASPLVQRALELGPDAAGAWNVLGRTELALHHTHEAAAAFQRACELDSAHAYARNNLGWLYLQQDRWNDALPLLETAVRLQGGIAIFQNNLGVVYERLGRWSEASAAYARAVELEPGRVNARLSLARVTAHLDPALAAMVPLDSTLAGRANPANP